MTWTQRPAVQIAEIMWVDRAMRVSDVDVLRRRLVAVALLLGQLRFDHPRLADEIDPLFGVLAGRHDDD